MNPRTYSRLLVLHVMVGVLLVVLAGRMWVLQVAQGERYQTIAANNRTRDIVVPAVLLRMTTVQYSARCCVRVHTAAPAASPNIPTRIADPTPYPTCKLCDTKSPPDSPIVLALIIISQ